MTNIKKNINNIKIWLISNFYNQMGRKTCLGPPWEDGERLEREEERVERKTRER